MTSALFRKPDQYLGETPKVVVKMQVRLANLAPANAIRNDESARLCDAVSHRGRFIVETATVVEATGIKNLLMFNFTHLGRDNFATN